jgi:hypothetical protein
MGYSTGEWQGDTLVVVSVGFNDASWLDDGGHPLTEGLRITERLTRRDVGHLDVQLTFEDPGAYARSWTVSLVAELVPDTELIEAECNEIDPDAYRLSGRTAEQESLTLTRETLQRYVGDYVRSAGSSAVTRYTVKLDGSELRLDVDGVGNLPLIPLRRPLFRRR